MLPHKRADSSKTPLDYETRLHKARRVVTIPFWVYAIHRVLLDNVLVFSIAYGLLVMMVGRMFKYMGVVFVVERER